MTALGDRRPPANFPVRNSVPGSATALGRHPPPPPSTPSLPSPAHHHSPRLAIPDPPSPNSDSRSPNSDSRTPNSDSRTPISDPRSPILPTPPSPSRSAPP